MFDIEAQGTRDVLLSIGLVGDLGFVGQVETGIEDQQIRFRLCRQAFAETTVAVAALKRAGYQVVAVEQTTGSVALPQFQPVAGRPLALVLGNEVFGVDDAVLALCDLAVEIPQFGTKHSLNVGVAAGVVLWDALLKLGVM